MHPVDAWSRRIELQAAAVSLFSKLIKPGIVVNVSEHVPGKFGIRSLDDSLPQDRDGFFIASALSQRKPKRQQAFDRIWIKFESTPGCLFSPQKVGCGVLAEIGALE